MNNKFRKYMAILALGISGGSIYLLPYIKYIFYNQQIEAMGITNQQSGFLLTMYAIGNVLLYIPGGILADKLSPKKCLLFSLISTTMLSVLFAFTLSYNIALVIWLLLSLTTILVFWASLIKTVRMIGTDEEQGRVFGIYYAVNGITGAAGNAIALWASRSAVSARAAMFNVAMVYSAVTVIAALMIGLFIENNKGPIVKKSEEDNFNVGDAVNLLKNPSVWLCSIIIFCGYSLYTSTSYFTPYLTSVFGISSTKSGIYSIIRNYLFMLLAPISGFIADRIFKSTCKWIMTGFFISVILFVGVLIIPEGTNAAIIGIYTLLPGAFALAVYGIEFSVISESKIPQIYTGTVVGIASVIGYSPDLFIDVLYGSWLDKYGNTGYTYIFIFIGVICVVGLTSAYILRRHTIASILHTKQQSVMSN